MRCGVNSDRISKIDGQLLVTIKVKVSDVKYVEFTPKRFVFYLVHIFLSRVSFRRNITGTIAIGTPLSSSRSL